jgi:hypothetical protein
VAPAKNPEPVPTAAAVRQSKSRIRFCSELEDTDYKQGVSKEIASGFQDKAARAPRPDSGLMVIRVSISPEHPMEDQPAFIKVKFENGGDNPVRIEQVQESLSRGGTRNVPNIALPVIVNPGGVKDLFESQIDLAGGEPYNKQYLVIDNRGDSWKAWFHLRPCS